MLFILRWFFTYLYVFIYDFLSFYSLYFGLKMDNGYIDFLI